MMRTTKCFVKVLDTGPGSSFVRFDELPRRLRDKIEPLAHDVNIKNTNRNPVRVH